MAITMRAGFRADVWADACTANGVDHQEKHGEEHAVAIGPGDKGTWSVRLKGLPGSVIQNVAQEDDDAIIGELYFTDATGVGWVKTSRGQLIERTSPLWVSLIRQVR